MPKSLQSLLDKALSAPLALALLASLAILATAYFFQYVLGYQPCDLCYYQRYPYMAVVLVAALGMLLLRRIPAAAISALALVGLLFVLNTGIAAYHVGVEQGWWQGPTACSGGTFDQGTADEILAQIKAAHLVRCDEPAWTLFGISIAGFNVMLAGILSIFSLIALRDRLAK